jgi:hypothetical protein
MQGVHNTAVTQLNHERLSAHQAGAVQRSQRERAERKVAELEGRLQEERQRHIAEVKALKAKRKISRSSQGKRRGSLREQQGQERERHAGVEAELKQKLAELQRQKEEQQESYEKWWQAERSFAAMREKQTEVRHMLRLCPRMWLLSGRPSCCLTTRCFHGVKLAIRDATVKYATLLPITGSRHNLAICWPPDCFIQCPSPLRT